MLNTGVTQSEAVAAAIVVAKQLESLPCDPWRFPPLFQVDFGLVAKTNTRKRFARHRQLSSALPNRHRKLGMTQFGS
jgi:hypothetical protein